MSDTSGTSPNPPGSPETNDDQSATVCYLCRQRKTKCDRQLPSCGYCIKAKVNCQYVAQPKKRGLRAGYVSELEARLEDVEQDLKRIKRSVNSPSTLETPTSLDLPLFSQTSSPSLSRSIPSVNTSTQQLSGTHRARDPSEAVRILREVPVALFHSLVDLWFKECQPWIPILKRSRLEESLALLTAPVERIDDIVLRALIALGFNHSSAAIVYGYKGRSQVSNHLRAEVLVEAMAKVSLDSLQALLIIAILDYGNDDIPSTWSLLSVTRRLCEQLGLYRRLLLQMQEGSPSQIGLPSREAFEGDELAIPLTWVNSALDSTSTLGASWRDASAAMMEHISSIAYTSAPDLRDSLVTHVHLAAIGLQPVHTYLYDQKNNTSSDATSMATVDDIYQNLMSYCPKNIGTYTYLPDGSIDFDCMSILTSILINGTAITLYGRHLDLSSPCSSDFSSSTTTTLPPSPTPPTHHQSIAIDRCSLACANIVSTIRNVSDADTELTSPLLSGLFFVAARYLLVLQKFYTSQPSHRLRRYQRSPDFDVIMHALNMCGRRWAVARRLDIVLRAAIVEVDDTYAFQHQQQQVVATTGTMERGAKLPAVFWDLRRSNIEIDTVLKEWVRGYRPSLFVGALNGPYA